MLIRAPIFLTYLLIFPFFFTFYSQEYQSNAPSSHRIIESTYDQEKIDDEDEFVCDRIGITFEVPTRLEKINNFRLDSLKKHLPKELANIVLDYAKINTKYTYMLTINCDKKEALCLSDPDPLKFLNNNTMAMSYVQNRIKIFILADKKFRRIQILVGHEGIILCIIQLSDDSIASCSADRTIKIWKVKNNKYYCAQTLVGHEGWVISIIQLQNGSIASCSDDMTIKIWSRKNGQYFCTQTIIDDHPIRYIIQFQNGSIASYSTSRTIKLWQNELNQICLN